MMCRRTRFPVALCMACRVGVACLLVAALAFTQGAGRACAKRLWAGPGAAGTERSVGSAGVDLFVARRGWHVDVGFPADAASASLQPLLRELPGARYLFLGFGDRRYLRAHHRLPAMLAALWPGRGLILATGLSASPAEAFGESHVIRLHISTQQWLAAQRFIRGSFGERGVAEVEESDPEGTRLASYEVAPGPYQGSVYYSSSATYSALYTCNTWVAQVLHSAGLPVRTQGVVFAGQLWSAVEGMAAAELTPGGGRAPVPTGR